MAKNIARSIVPGKLMASIHRARLKRELDQFVRYEVSNDYGGTNLRVLICDRMSADWYGKGCPIPEIHFLRRHGLNSGAVVFDLGAHQCVVALSMAAEVGVNGRVVAVEAHPHNMEVAEKNKRLNGSEQLYIVGAAVSDVDGEIEFNCGLNGSVAVVPPHSAGFRVPAVSVDTLAQKYGQPGVVLLDVEGFEQKVLRGANSVIEHGATFLIEMHVGCGLEAFGGSVAGVVGSFPDRSYQLWMFSDEQPAARPFHPADPLMQSRFYLAAVKCEEVQEPT